MIDFKQMIDFKREVITNYTEEELEEHWPGSIWVKQSPAGTYVPCMHNDPEVVGMVDYVYRKLGVSQQKLIDNPDRFHELTTELKTLNYHESLGFELQMPAETSKVFNELPEIRWK